MVSPPHSSQTTPFSCNCVRAIVGLAEGWSILLTATMIGTSAACAWLRASIVCGMTPSSAPMTRMTMSVTLAPRARMALNAAWPGVSRKVIFSSFFGFSGWGTSMVYAPICCVMPPASPAVMLDLRMTSSSVVLPWSTWPMIVTTGARCCRSSSLSSASSSTFFLVEVLTRPAPRSRRSSRKRKPFLAQISRATGSSMDWLMLAKTLSDIRSAISWNGLRFISSARSRTMIGVFMAINGPSAGASYFNLRGSPAGVGVACSASVGLAGFFSALSFFFLCSRTAGRTGMFPSSMKPTFLPRSLGSSSVS